ncbi:MAG: sce7726 family protein [Pyrinomonadaceae bacterium]
MSGSPEAVGEREIRDALWRRLATEYGGTGACVLDELGLCGGSALVEVAVIAEDHVSGYEIKSERDSLSRLAEQARVYNRALHRVTIVAATRHLAGVLRLVPGWWGVVEALSDGGGGCALVERRGWRENPGLCLYSLSQLLWREEALHLLTRRGLDRGVRSKGRREVWRRLAENVPAGELSRAVCRQLKSRADWRELWTPGAAGETTGTTIAQT